MRHLIAILLIPLLASCGGTEGEVEEPNPFGPTGIPPMLRRGGSMGGTPIGPRGNAIPESFKNNPGVVLDPDEIVYTDPDAEDPEGAMSELKELLSAVPSEGPWRKSFTNAFKEARQTDKPVLMWFTDSQNSPNCRQLSQELFNQQEFEDWAEETFVRLQIDQRLGSVLLDNNESRKKDYVASLKKRYKVRGQPTMLVLTPSGEVIGRYKGYRRGQADYKWGQLRQGAMLASQAHVKWKAKMEKKGYRIWSDPRGRKLFAKLIYYRKGTLVLLEPDGTRAKTKEKNLSPKDQDWITALKRSRGME